MRPSESISNTHLHEDHPISFTGNLHLGGMTLWVLLFLTLEWFSWGPKFCLTSLGTLPAPPSASLCAFAHQVCLHPDGLP